MKERPIGRVDASADISASTLQQSVGGYFSFFVSLWAGDGAVQLQLPLPFLYPCSFVDTHPAQQAARGSSPPPPPSRSDRFCFHEMALFSCLLGPEYVFHLNCFPTPLGMAAFADHRQSILLYLPGPLYFLAWRVLCLGAFFRIYRRRREVVSQGGSSSGQGYHTDRSTLYNLVVWRQST